MLCFIQLPRQVQLFSIMSAIFCQHKHFWIRKAVYHHPAIYSGDFKCHHRSLVYSSNNSDTEALHDWAHTLDLKLLLNHKQTKSFHSPIWNTCTNAYLMFYLWCKQLITTSSPQNWWKFSKITTSPNTNSSHSFIEYTPTTPILHWYFNKADLRCFKTQSLQLCVIIFLHLTQTLTHATLRSSENYSILQRGLFQGVFMTPIFHVRIPHVKC